ncbi:isoprenyl transferase [Desulfomonile tiedjei]|uniref:Isoprenyl transferase n=1 Tax=Desulfomonile tiedjei (strain ATCC 49306 / DSM 6799 / DCB-1) TaxID=706587 RepID=I4CAM7_DESTA|nr:isoprenyl transferase [Desulfomonile tiedjei]AFM26618.1 undecaprenyl diphosphate synthase [Desulfomonile tiedjei DSM 6799]
MSFQTDSQSNFPRHVAIVMDGNGRWAKRRLLPRLEGHRQGAKSVRRAVEFCRRNGIEYLTLYAFSTENWKRPQGEVSGLMKLLMQFIDSELEEIHANDIRLMTIGDLKRLPPHVVEKIQAAIEKTSQNKSMVLNIALSYGGRQDIVNAVLQVHEAIQAGKIEQSEVTEETFEQYLDTASIPDPDLLIRTGGEQRLSNFLLWQSAYAELYFSTVLWPDFDDAEFMKAIEEYRSRQRRFGMISEQIEAEGRRS